MIKKKAIPEGRECNHVTCGNKCHRDAPVVNPRKPIVRRRTSPKPISNNETTVIEDELNDWFLQRVKEATGTCCNCGGFSSVRSGIYWKWSICHIFPKDKKFGFPSVATHPFNWIELCIQCHTLFDRSLSVASTLKCWPIAVARFINFKDEIKETDRRYYSLFKEFSGEKFADNS